MVSFYNCSIKIQGLWEAELSIAGKQTWGLTTLPPVLKFWLASLKEDTRKLLKSYKSQSCQKLTKNFAGWPRLDVLNHGCHRHQFSKFPDFSLIKVKFPWPNKYKISDMVPASDLRFRAILCTHLTRNVFSNLWWHKISLIISILPNFSSKCQFSLTLNKIPWHFPDL